MDKTEKVTITQLYRNDTDKNGNPLINKKTNQPYRKIVLQTKEYGDRYITGFCNEENSSWKVGDTVKIEIEQKGEYLNIKTQSKTVKRQEFEELSKRVDNLENITTIIS
jgi:CYTH domain-containing protein